MKHVNFKIKFIGVFLLFYRKLSKWNVDLRFVYVLTPYSFYRFTNPEDKKWFENALVSVCRHNIGEEYMSHLPEEPFFVDFLREAPEPTGEEAEDAVLEAPKIYELVGGCVESQMLSCLVLPLN